MVLYVEAVGGRRFELLLLFLGFGLDRLGGLSFLLFFFFRDLTRIFEDLTIVVCAVGVADFEETKFRILTFRLQNHFFKLGAVLGHDLCRAVRDFWLKEYAWYRAGAWSGAILWVWSTSCIKNLYYIYKSIYKSMFNENRINRH